MDPIIFIAAGVSTSAALGGAGLLWWKERRRINQATEAVLAAPLPGEQSDEKGKNAKGKKGKKGKATKARTVAASGAQTALGRIAHQIAELREKTHQGTLKTAELESHSMAQKRMLALLTHEEQKLTETLLHTDRLIHQRAIRIDAVERRAHCILHGLEELIQELVYQAGRTMHGKQQYHEHQNLQLRIQHLSRLDRIHTAPDITGLETQVTEIRQHIRGELERTRDQRRQLERQAKQEEYMQSKMNPEPQYPEFSTVRRADGTGYAGRRRSGPDFPVTVAVDAVRDRGDAEAPFRSRHRNTLPPGGASYTGGRPSKVLWGPPKRRAHRDVEDTNFPFPHAGETEEPPKLTRPKPPTPPPQPETPLFTPFTLDPELVDSLKPISTGRGSKGSGGDRQSRRASSPMTDSPKSTRRRRSQRHAKVSSGSLHASTRSPTSPKERSRPVSRTGSKSTRGAPSHAELNAAMSQF
eukprot:Hpha_TRINITY_DN27660_c0_g1::TRINITY_DN27660_c0_g1_i1::g.57477::m.57477